MWILENYDFIYPYFYNKDGSLNIDNIINKDKIIKDLWDKFNKKKLKLIYLDKDSVKKLKINLKKYEIDYVNKSTVAIYQKPKLKLKGFEHIKEQGRKTINWINNRLKAMGFRKNERDKVLINIFVNRYSRFTKKEKDMFLKKAKDSLGNISYHKLYDLRYENLLKKGEIKKDLKHVNEESL